MLFLKHIGSLPPELQTALLRVFHERTIKHLEGQPPIPVDVRILDSDLHRCAAAALRWPLLS
jgi:transcriptional regulator of acetoin/glycerol metabolism